MDISKRHHRFLGDDQHINPWPGTIFDAPGLEEIFTFQEYLHKRGVTVMVRKERGSDIMAACGQLAGGNI